MRILQFAFGDPDNRFLPHNYDPNTVVYTGTHDNDTTVGWYADVPPDERAFLHRYLPGVGHDIAWDLIRLALVERGRLRHRPAARHPEPADRGADELPRPARGQLGLALHRRPADPGASSTAWPT